MVTKLQSNQTVICRICHIEFDKKIIVLHIEKTHTLDVKDLIMGHLTERRDGSG